MKKLGMIVCLTTIMVLVATSGASGADWDTLKTGAGYDADAPSYGGEFISHAWAPGGVYDAATISLKAYSIFSGLDAADRGDSDRTLVLVERGASNTIDYSGIYFTKWIGSDYHFGLYEDYNLTQAAGNPDGTTGSGEYIKNSDILYTLAAPASSNTFDILGESYGMRYPDGTPGGGGGGGPITWDSLKSNALAGPENISHAWKDGNGYDSNALAIKAFSIFGGGNPLSNAIDGSLVLIDCDESNANDYSGIFYTKWSSGQIMGLYLDSALSTPAQMGGGGDYIKVSGDEIYKLAAPGESFDLGDFSPGFIPEPATMSLLAIGGLAALARRRRQRG